MTRYMMGDIGDVYPGWSKAHEKEALTIPMTLGRTAWGHQVIELIPKTEVATYRRKGWRVYHAAYENSPWSLFIPYWLWKLGGGERDWEGW